MLGRIAHFSGQAMTAVIRLGSGSSALDVVP
jgi:hypothetical protein